MWFKINDERTAAGCAYTVRCITEIAGQSVRNVLWQGSFTTRAKPPSPCGRALDVARNRYGRDGQGEFVYGVEEVADGAAQATDPVVKRLYAEAASVSVHFRDPLMAAIPEQTIKGFAAMAAALGNIVTEHKKAKRSSDAQRSPTRRCSVFSGHPEPCAAISLDADDATIALLTKSLNTRQVGCVSRKSMGWAMRNRSRSRPMSSRTKSC